MMVSHCHGQNWSVLRPVYKTTPKCPSCVTKHGLNLSCFQQIMDQSSSRASSRINTGVSIQCSIHSPTHRPAWPSKADDPWAPGALSFQNKQCKVQGTIDRCVQSIDRCVQSVASIRTYAKSSIEFLDKTEAI